MIDQPVAPIRLTILIVCLVVPAIAGAADGGVYLYLQPLPPEAARLTFAVASVAAVTASGSEHPLTVSLKSAGPADTGRQRLLASGRLPAGSYAGFSFKIRQASLKNAGGDAALAVPDTPARLDAPFTVSGNQSPLFWLTLRYQESLAGGVSFSPVFSAVAPTRPIADHAGFVTNTGSNTITVFDKSITQAVAVIDTCAGPAGMALDRLRRRLYLACSKEDEIQSIDVATGQVIERTRLSPGDRPREVALTPDGLTLVSANTGSNSISIFEAVSLTRQERISVGSGPGSVLIDPGGRRAFAFNTLSGSLSVIDLASRSLAATLSTDAAPLRGKFSRMGDRLYIIHERSPYMTVLDPRQLNVVTRARLKVGVSAIEVDTVRGLVCIGGDSDTTVEFYDPNALMPVYSMRIRSGVSHLTIDAEDNCLYMVSPGTRSVIVGRLADRKAVSEIDVGDGPCWVAVMGEK
jgi:YVTN family beta-propeller protein